MNQCVIDVDRSPLFRKSLAAFIKKYPRLINDLKEAFERIEQSPRTAAEARRQPGKFGNQEIYKYRCKSIDLQRAANKAFRIIGLYEPERNRMTALAIYLKPDTMTEKEIIAAIRALIGD